MSSSPRFRTTGLCFPQIHVYYVNVLEVFHEKIIFLVIHVYYIVLLKVFRD